MKLRIVEQSVAAEQKLFEVFGDPGIAKWVLDPTGKPGLTVELADVYPDTQGLAMQCLEEGLAILRGAFAPISPPASKSTIQEVLEILAKRYARLSMAPGQTVLSLAGSPICLRSHPQSLEISRRGFGPALLDARSDLRRWIAAVNADVRLARILFDGKSLAFGARLPIPGPVASVDIVAAVEESFQAILTLERAAPRLTTVLQDAFAPVLSLIT